MKNEVSMMTNRELFEEYKANPKRYEILAEMTKRIKRKMFTPDVVQIFKQYKLNGAGDQRF